MTNIPYTNKMYSIGPLKDKIINTLNDISQNCDIWRKNRSKVSSKEDFIKFKKTIEIDKDYNANMKQQQFKHYNKVYTKLTYNNLSVIY